MKYTIKLDTGEAAYIETRYPLNGDEPVIKQRFEILKELYEDREDSTLIKFLKLKYEQSTNKGEPHGIS